MFCDSMYFGKDEPKFEILKFRYRVPKLLTSHKLTSLEQKLREKGSFYANQKLTSPIVEGYISQNRLLQIP